LVVKSASIQVSPLLVVEEPGQRVLYGGATMANDAIAVRRISDSQFGIKLSATGSETIYNYGSMGTPVQRLVLYGLDGNDTITIDPLLTLPVSLYGGSGNDVLRGGGGDDIIVGGDGLDQLYGFGGSDLIIGGTGRDTLYGAGDQDIIVAGSTLLDDNLLATQAILKYWTSKSSDMTLAWYQTRVATIRDVGVGSGAWRLNAATTIDDNAIDTIYAAAGVPSGSPRKLNWYLRNTLGTGLRDSLIGGMANEESTDNRNA
jgi:Ca2+-binding RTX toxin-like protein